MKAAEKEDAEWHKRLVGRSVCRSVGRSVLSVRRAKPTVSTRRHTTKKTKPHHTSKVILTKNKPVGWRDVRTDEFTAHQFISLMRGTIVNRTKYC